MFSVLLIRFENFWSTSSNIHKCLAFLVDWIPSERCCCSHCTMLVTLPSVAGTSRSPPWFSAGSSRSPGQPAVPPVGQVFRSERSSAVCSSRSRRWRRSCPRRSVRAPSHPPSSHASSRPARTAPPPSGWMCPSVRQTARRLTTGSTRGLPLAQWRVWEVLDPLLQGQGCVCFEIFLNGVKQICKRAKVYRRLSHSNNWKRCLSFCLFFCDYSRKRKDSGTVSWPHKKLYSLA